MKVMRIIGERRLSPVAKFSFLSNREILSSVDGIVSITEGKSGDISFGEVR